MRRVVLILVAMSGLIAMSATAGGVADFGDVESERFYTEPVQWMVDEDITTGTSRACFSPDDPVTRGQAAAFMWRMEGEPAPASAHPFVDVLAPWQQDPVSWMFEEGITTGTAPDMYSPDRILNRGEMAALIHRAAGEPAGAPPHSFNDVVKDWQQVPVSWMADEEITTGTTPETFSPDDPVTRGQFAAFAYRWKGEPAVVVSDISPLCLGIDEFDGGLEQGWTYTSGDPAGRSFVSMPGYLSLTGSTIGSPDAAQELTRDPVADEYEIETKVSFAPVFNFQKAGLIVREGEDDSVLLSRTFCDPAANVACVGDGLYFDNTVGGVGGTTVVALAPGTGDVWLRIRHEGGTYTGSYSLDGAVWTEIDAYARVLADSAYGLIAGLSLVEPVPEASFDYFMEMPV